MKMNKKKVFVVALAVSLIAILTFGTTLAWFSAEDDVTNKFMVATSDDNEDSVFSIDVLEQVDTDGDGQYDATFDAVPDEGGATYKEILPGDELGKKPWVRNTGSYDEYVRVKLTLNNAAAWKALFAKYSISVEDLLVGYIDAVWNKNEAETSEDTTKDTITYVYYLDRILEPKKDGGRDAYLFTDFKIPSQFTQKDMTTFTYNQIDATTGNYVFELNVLAEAVQTANVSTVTGNVANDAIAAFDTVMD